MNLRVQTERPTSHTEPSAPSAPNAVEKPWASSRIERARTMVRLGPQNILRVLRHRRRIERGEYLRAMPIGEAVRGPFFEQGQKGGLALANWQQSPWCRGRALGFGYIEQPLEGDAPPAWSRSLISGFEVPSAGRHWSTIEDFSSPAGDIKAFWEYSRFGWLAAFVGESMQSGDSGWLDLANTWLEDWSHHNPVNAGIQWKCGQEAGIRVMHMVMAQVVGGWTITPACATLLRQHLARIEVTLEYAMAQDNNHGTSEACGLYVGGLLLQARGEGNADDQRWIELGRSWLEDRADVLIAADGTFAQYSTNYHRLMLDTLCFAEQVRRVYADRPFSPTFYVRAEAASRWLANFCDPISGRAPNLGANDGAQIFPLVYADYGDFSISVALAAAIFLRRRYTFASPAAKNTLALWQVEPKVSRPLPPARSECSSAGGWQHLVQPRAHCYFSAPRFEFRPSQCDGHHLDLWIDGVNWLRDAGTYSYNTDEPWQSYFSSVAAHNSAQFDGMPQMPRISRFLFGSWLQTKLECIDLAGPVCRVESSYRNASGALHRRRVELATHQLKVRDQLAGFNQSVVLRWRLRPGDWRTTADGVECDGLRVKLSSTVEIARTQLVTGWESLRYLERTPVPVLEIELERAGQVTTEFDWR